MDETKDEEKLLINPLDAPELPPSGETTPLLTAKEFIKITPSHELKNVFGQSSEEILAPTWTPPSAPVAKSEKTSREFKNLQNLSHLSPPKPWLAKKTLRIFTTLFLIVLILMVALYIWGALLQK